MYTQTRVSSCNVHLSHITAGIFFLFCRKHTSCLSSQQEAQ